MSDIDFKRLGEVDVNDSPADDANVFIEEEGVVKRTPKSAIGAQSDWNETDETKPSYIVNKPTSLGGIAKYFLNYNKNMLFKTDDMVVPDDFDSSKAATMDEFREDFLSGGCLVNKLNSNNENVNVNCMVTYFAPYGSSKAMGHVSMANTMGNSSLIKFREP